MSFFHGITVTEVNTGGQTIQVVNSAVIGLIGSAPQWSAASGAGPGINVPTLVSTQNQASNFGKMIVGYTIPEALDAIQKQNAGSVVVIDVFNPVSHQTVVAPESLTGPAVNAIPVFVGHMGLVGPGLPNYGTLATTVTVTNSGATITYVEGTDYTIDYVNGLLYTKVGGSITVSEALKVGFAYCDPSKVIATDIVGTVTAGVYTGIQALQTTFQTMGLFAKLLITPRFQDTVTSAALLAMAVKIRAYAFTDAAPATTVSAAIANRGTSGTTFNQASDRLGLTFPWQMKSANAILPTGVTVSAQGVIGYTYASGTVDTPYSTWVAGATSAKDISSGYWYSPSNTVITGILGPDISMYMSAYDSASDTNLLNAAGIITVFNGFGTGYRVWGNRSSSFPASSSVTTFIAIRRTLDVIEQSIQYSSLPYLDQPITNGLINTIMSTVNAFINSLIQQGALITGSKVTYDPSNNTSAQLAAGQLTFNINVMPPPPAEQIIYQFSVDTSLLANLGASVSSTSSSTTNVTA